MNFDDKIKELKIELPEAKAPVGSYVATKIVGKLLYVSGQISIDEKGVLIKGKVGRDLNTDDMRDSSSLEMIPYLSKNGAKIKYYDPTGFKKEFNKIKNVTFSNSISHAVKESDLVILHTEWNDFKSINFKKLHSSKNLKIYDMRNIYSSSKIKAQGFKYFSVGR